jgi:hypothetical protein
LLQEKGVFHLGFKEGRGRIAIIRRTALETDVHVRHVDCQSASEAEDLGIKLAVQMFPGDEPIYNDNQHAVTLNAPRALWLRREQNKEADELSNLRGQTAPPAELF